MPTDILAFTVGSEPGNDIVLKDDKVSMFHLRFEREGDRYYIKDMLSAHGTFLNGTRIKERTPVEDLDEIALGRHKIIVEYPNPYARWLNETTEAVWNEVPAASPVEDRLAGVPSLSRLNAWLQEDNGQVNNQMPNEQSGQTQRRHAQSEVLAEKQTPGVRRTPFSMDHELEEIEDYDSVERRGDFFIQRQDEAPPKSEPPVTFRSEPPDRSTAEPEATPPPENRTTPEEERFKQHPAPKGEPERLSYYLVGIYGRYLGERFKLKYPETRIGRDRRRNDIVINRNITGKSDYGVSRRQATIRFRNNTLYVIDKRSKSSTFVNQKRVGPRDKVPFLPGDELEIIGNKKSHIFRLVRESDWDFSFPKRAGVWHVRYRMLLLNVLSALLVLGAAYTLVSSVLTANRIASKPEPLSFAEEPWYDDLSLQFDPSAVDGYAAGMADVDGDGYLDLLFVDGNDHLKCVSGRTRQVLWVNPEFKALPNIGLTLADLNNNGLPDVLVVSRDVRLRAIDGKWGVEIWKSPLLQAPLTGPPAVGNLNADHLPDVAVASAGDGAIYLGHSGLETDQWFKLECDEPLSAPLVCADINGDGRDNVLAGTETGKLLFVDGVANRIAGQLNINEELNKATGRFDFGNALRHPPALGDLTGDGVNELVVVTARGNLIVFDGVNLQRLWFDQAPATEDSAAFTASVALGDFDGDELLDVVTVNTRQQLRVMKGLGQGKDRIMLLWEYPANGAGDFTPTPALADFNKNGTDDVIGLSERGRLEIFEGATGQRLWNSAPAGAPVVGQPLVADLGGDHRLDVITLRSDGGFYRHASNRATTGAALIWGQRYGNSRNTGLSFHVTPRAGVYWTYAVVAVLVMAVVAGGHGYFRRRRNAVIARMAAR